MRSFFLSITMVLFAGLALAQDFSNMSDSQREDFGAAVRAYLLENPEVIMEAVAVLEERQTEQAASSDQDLITQNFDALFNDGYSFVDGNPDGTLLMVEFIDYKCGYCKKAHPDVKILLENNPDIRLIIKEFPILGEESTLSARAAVAVLINDGDEIYGAFSDALMTENGPLNEISVPMIAESVGADSAKMMEMLDSPIITQIIQSNYALARAMQISGTPSFVMADRLMRGYVPLAQMQQIVDDVREAQN
ncbi:MAG: DsbA family protein [Rhodobacteraceae bacterium]|nr:DsbA family protein [Paracoccaceae bacterium]